MLNRIKKELENIKHDGWLIESIESDKVELFFIRKDLEMNRGVNVKEYSVTVYRESEEDGKKFIGSSRTNIAPSMNEEEIRETLEVASLAASFVKNEYYELVDPTDEKPLEMKTKFGENLTKYVNELVDAVFKEDKYEQGGINSVEFFLTKHNIRRLNSKGLDITYTKFNGMIEMIAEWKDKGEETELYKMIRFSDFDPKNVSDEVSAVLSEAMERANAIPTPQLDVPVILTKEPVKQLFDYYAVRTNAQYMYEGLFDTKIGDSVQGENVTGDNISITMNPVLVNSTVSSPYDSDGFLLKDIEIIKDGKVTDIIASKRYADYLNLTPTGHVANVVVKAGEITEKEMKKEPYLELFKFSAFQMDPLTGDFGGEIRLGRYFDGEKVVPVTGGSLTGNIKNIQSSMTFSKELEQHNNFLGPKSIKIANFSLASAE